MKKFRFLRGTVLPFLIFLISLIIFKAIIAGIIFVLIFKAVEVSFDLYISLKSEPRFEKWFSLLGDILIVLLLTFAVYNLFFSQAERLLVNVFFVVPKIPAIYSNLFFIIIFLLFLSFNWQKVKGKAFFGLLLVLEIAGAVVYLSCRKEKLSREYLPKIYRVSASEGYQGEKLEINGVNFYPSFKKGEVVLGEAGDLTISLWGENKIIGVIPVPAKFGTMDLVVKREDGITSNIIKFEIKDPGKLKK
ncbi:hypothetical protein KKD61_04065 [Patescibacteria group bacterium]|nr:hypothetical protein [Patescibacteria group bacterium]